MEKMCHYCRKSFSGVGYQRRGIEKDYCSKRCFQRSEQVILIITIGIMASFFLIVGLILTLIANQLNTDPADLVYHFNPLTQFGSPLILLIGLVMLFYFFYLLYITSGIEKHQRVTADKADVSLISEKIEHKGQFQESTASV